MRKIVILFVFIVLASESFATEDPVENKKIATFCKVWGFLKYFHPEVAKGKQDWDDVFMQRIVQINALHSKESLDAFYLKWIDDLGEIKDCKKCGNPSPDALRYNEELSLLHDSISFGPALLKQLNFIRQNRNQEENFYVQSVRGVGNTSYENEKLYKDSTFPSKQMRLLCLSRYWNIVNYFYPYKYVIGRNWNAVLDDMIPLFRDAKDTTAYHLAITELTSSINDSHAGFRSQYVSDFLGLKSPDFKCTLIDNKAIVTGFYIDSLCLLNDIRIGDVFLTVDDKSIEQIIKEKSKYTGASNPATKLRNLSYTIFNGSSDVVAVSFERNGKIIKKIIGRYIKTDKWYVNTDTIKYKILDGNIGYVNLGPLEKKDVKDILAKMTDTKAIIFDVRNYPQGTMSLISDFLNSEATPFVKFTYPLITDPGIFLYTAVIKAGKNNPGYYKGKTVILFNETTQSHAEFTCMALQTAPDHISIGSQTAGADGNVSSIFLPGGYKTYMTGIGVFYPDGKETQRIGIIPDIEVKPTIAGIRAGRDEVLDKAIKVINEK